MTKNKIVYTATIESSSKKQIWFAKPTNDPNQKILDFKLNQAILAEYKDNQDNQVAYFELPGGRSTIEAQFECEFKPFQVKSDWVPKITKKQSRYLKDEEYLEQTVELLKLAEELSYNFSDEPATIVKNFFKYVAEKFSYEYPVQNRGVSHMNLSAPIGDCGEYSSLFVALCRAAKIPARNKVGWVIFEETGNVNQHEWAEILGSNGTWYPMDTQYASLEEGIDPIETPYFGGFPEKRLVLTSGYNIPLKPKAEGIEQSDIEIPFAVRESISCLQPFAVSSPTDIFFEEEIRIGR